MSHPNITSRGNGPIKKSLARRRLRRLALVLAGCAGGATTTPTASGAVPEGADPAIYNSLPDENKSPESSPSQRTRHTDPRASSTRTHRARR